MSLLIVESPAKAKKIQAFLDKSSLYQGFKVLSSFGHINNLDTKKLDDMIHDNFTPIYKHDKDKAKVIKELKGSAHNKDIILAADDDREGDAIAWHCGNLVNADYTQKNRIIFNEISKNAIERALQNKHTLNMNSVNAQRCRQLLDLIIGFKLSPLLWKHIQTPQKGLSAGRVQSTLLRMLKDHEDTIKGYEPEFTYDFTGTLHDINHTEHVIEANFVISDEYYELIDSLDCRSVLTLMKDNRQFLVTDRKDTTEKRSPPSPFITSTLQQAAQNELGFPIKMTMDIAQKLYDNGKITYMRTDSTFLSPDFKECLQRHITESFGPQFYRSPKSRKVKGSQNAHECIRPTNLSKGLSEGYKEAEQKLYNLILQRTITSHMKPAVYDVCKINLTNEATSHIGLFLGITKSLSFEGFLRYTGQSKGDKKDKKGNKSFDDIEWCHLREAEIKETESNPPHYYNESTIVKKLESSGVGRPSTYASIVNTLYNRNYTLTRDIEGVHKEEPYHKLHTTDTITKGIHKLTTPKQKKRIVLTDLGETVLEYLLKHFDTMICIEFTAQVETDLDLISTGQSDFHTVIKKVYDVFYPVIAEQLQVKRVSSDALYIGSTEVRNGKYGYYINVSGKNYGLTTYMKMSKKKIEQLTDEDVLYLTEYPKCIGVHKGHDVMLHIGPYGIYMKYNKKNYRVNRVKEHTLASLSPLLP